MSDTGNYCNIQDRIDSFRRHYNQHLWTHVVRLAEAGYYLTENDMLVCLSCGKVLEKLPELDNIWEWLAGPNSPCLHIKAKATKYCEEEYINIQSKWQVFGEKMENIRLKERLLCKICASATSNIVIEPCHHFCLCKNCAIHVIHCPSCRQPIKNKLPVYLATISHERLGVFGRLCGLFCCCFGRLSNQAHT